MCLCSVSIMRAGAVSARGVSVECTPMGSSLFDPACLVVTLSCLRSVRSGRGASVVCSSAVSMPWCYCNVRSCSL